MRTPQIVALGGSLLRPEELENRKKQWKKPEPNYKSGALAKFATLVGSAANGAVTYANP